MPKLREPSLRQQQFIDAYLETGNATEAALAAGYKCRSRTVAQSIGSENLLKPMIAARLAQRRAEISAQTGITIESQQLALLSDIERARAAGAWGAVMSGHATLLKSIGGMTGDRPHPDAMAGKRDKRQDELLRAIADEYMARKYLAKPVAKQIEVTECFAQAGTGSQGQAAGEGRPEETPGSDPEAPQAPGG